MLQPAVAGVIGLMGLTSYLAVHHLAIRWARPRESLHLWLGVWCAFSLLMQSGRLLQYIAPDGAQAVTGMRIALGTSFVLVWLLVRLCGIVVRRPIGRVPMALFLGLNLGIAALTVFTPWLVTDETRSWSDPLGNVYPWVQMGPAFPAVGPYATCVLVVGSSWIVRATTLPWRARLLFLAGFCVSFAIGLNDLLIAQGAIRSVVAFEWGPVALALAFDVFSQQRFHGLNEDLEDEVEERTEQLRTALAGAEAGARARSAFLANMSHELRTPMNGVLGTLRLLVDEPLGANARRLAETAHGSAASLLGLLDEVLDLAEIETGRLQTEQAPFEPRALLREVTALHRPACIAKALDFRSVIDDSVPEAIPGDERRVRQILNHLLHNAIRFTDEGEIAVRVASDGRSVLRLEVADSGPGIPDGLQPRLFQPFAQGDESARRRHGGTGLGLAISQQLARAMHGELGVESKAGGGSVFTLTLPFQPADTMGRAEESETRPEVLPDGLRILLAEDNAVNELVATAMLERLGCRVEVAKNGLEVLERSREATFDIVLMDCQMPELDGFEATRRLRRRERELGERRRPIVAVTAHATRGDRELCLGAGMDDYLTKPFTLSELRTMLVRWYAG